MQYDFDLVGKIGSMALIRREEKDIDYNIFSRLGAELRPGMIWVSSGAVEIGRLDYIKRTGHELTGDPERCERPTTPRRGRHPDGEYRQFIRPNISVRQLLVEHHALQRPGQARAHPQAAAALRGAGRYADR